jgi:hypothetical protein
MTTVEAVIVNHNTSVFAELAVRSLASSIAGGSESVRITVRDNHSSDDGLPARRDAVASLGASFERSRWPATSTPLNSHGDVLRDFVLDKPDADFYLFVDADIDFEEQATVRRMVDELEADRALWAVQARFRTAEAKRVDGTLDVNAGGQPVELDVRQRSGEWRDTAPISGRVQPRCHPGATLVRNGDALQRLATTLGFGTAYLVSGDEAVAGFYDTFGLATAAMAVHGLRYGLSSATVHHYFCVSYDPAKRAPSEADCKQRLRRFA